MENKPIDLQSENRKYSGSMNCLENKVAESAKTLDSMNDQVPILSTLINTIPNPAFCENAQGVFVECNHAFAETILGTTCENIVGRSVYNLPDIIPQVLCDICLENDQELLSNPAYRNTKQRSGVLMVSNVIFYSAVQRLPIMPER